MTCLASISVSFGIWWMKGNGHMALFHKKVPAAQQQVKSFRGLAQNGVKRWDLNICRYPQHRCMTVASSLEPSPCQSAKCCLVSNPYDAELDQAVNQAWSKDIINSDFWMGWSIYCAQVVRIGFYLVHISSTKHNPMAALFVWRGWFFGARLRDGFCKLPGGRWDRGPTAEIDPWGRRPWKIPSETGTVRQSLRFLVIRKGRQVDLQHLWRLGIEKSPCLKFGKSLNMYPR